MMRRKWKIALAGISAAAVMILGSAAMASEEAAAMEASETEEEESTAAEEYEENEDTGDASLDKERNENGIGEAELLVLSYGTSYNDSRRLAIGAVEQALEETFPDWSVRRGFTSKSVISHIEKRDGVRMDNINQALSRAANNDVKKLVIQPTHLMKDTEYDEIMEITAEYADSFESVAVGEPLLTSEEDFDIVADAVIDATKEYDDGATAIVLVGHGAEGDANQIYEKMQQVLTDKGMEHYFVGTITASPSLADILEAVQAQSCKRVVLRPLMVTSGACANENMAGDKEGTWKTAFEKAGYEVIPVLEGLGQIPAIQELYGVHARAAIDSLVG